MGGGWLEEGFQERWVSERKGGHLGAIWLGLRADFSFTGYRCDFSTAERHDLGPAAGSRSEPQGVAGVVWEGQASCGSEAEGAGRCCARAASSPHSAVTSDPALLLP